MKNYVIFTFTSNGKQLERQTMPEQNIVAVAATYLNALKAACNGPQLIEPVRMFISEIGNIDNSLDIAIGQDFKKD
jgi:hypothetical protein